MEAALKKDIFSYENPQEIKDYGRKRAESILKHYYEMSYPDQKCRKSRNAYTN